MNMMWPLWLDTTAWENWMGLSYLYTGLVIPALSLGTAMAFPLVWAAGAATRRQQRKMLV